MRHLRANCCDGLCGWSFNIVAGLDLLPFGNAGCYMNTLNGQKGQKLTKKKWKPLLQNETRTYKPFNWLTGSAMDLMLLDLAMTLHFGWQYWGFLSLGDGFYQVIICC